MRRFRQTLLTAIHSLRRNLTRALLTTLGIVIGISAVIAMMEIGNGSSNAIKRNLASMGASSLSISPGNTSTGGVSSGSGGVKTLTPQDCDAIIANCPAVKNAAPVVRARTQIVYGNRNWVPFFIYGTTPEFIDVRNWKGVSDGEVFTERDVRTSAKVCVIGETIVKELFGGGKAVGKEVRINNVPFRVAGVLNRKGANMMGMDQDDILIAPWSTLKSRVAGSSVGNVNQSGSSSSGSSATSLSSLYPESSVSLYPEQSSTQATNSPHLVRFTNVDEIILAARSTADIQNAIKQVTSVLRERHRLNEGEVDDFSVRDMTEMSNALSSTTLLMSRLLLFVALISLVVGGVGIMNIMLVSVTERTREIGLRMAVGARSRDIMRQFLVESIVLCLAGGAVGILLGRGMSTLVRVFLNWPIEASIPAAVTAVCVSAAVGIVFGYYPAWKASRLDPIDALRYE